MMYADDLLLLKPIPSFQRDVKQWTYQNHFLKLYKTKYRIISRGRPGGCNYGLNELLQPSYKLGGGQNETLWDGQNGLFELLNSPKRLEVFKTGSPHSFTPRQSKLPNYGSL